MREASLKLAAGIAENSPPRLDRDAHDYGRRPADRVLKATEHKLHEQTRLRKTDKFKEGVKAVAERRVLNFTGR